MMNRADIGSADSRDIIAILIGFLERIIICSFIKVLFINELLLE